MRLFKYISYLDSKKTEERIVVLSDDKYYYGTYYSYLLGFDMKKTLFEYGYLNKNIMVKKWYLRHKLTYKYYL